MASSLRSKLGELASSFANDVLDAIRSASIEDLVAESSSSAGRRAPAARAAAVHRAPAVRPAAAGGRRRDGRLARRSAGDIAGFIDRIVNLVKASPKGLRAEQIRRGLGVQAKELPRPLKEAVDAGRLGKSGQKRATTYFLKGGAPSPRPVAPAGKAPKKAKRGGARKTAKKAAKKK
jgi:hypothetical protein